MSGANGKSGKAICLLGSGADNLVSLDESGINIDMTRHYARAKTDERAVDSIPLNMPCNTTILSSIRLDGRAAHTAYQGETTAERFAEYLKETLLPSLSSDNIIIMDNMRSHHAKAVKQLLDASRIRYLNLPPYSPDFNPIEKCGQRLRHICVKQKSVHCWNCQTQLKTPFQQLPPPITWAGFLHAVMCSNLVDCYNYAQFADDSRL